VLYIQPFCKLGKYFSASDGDACLRPAIKTWGLFQAAPSKSKPVSKKNSMTTPTPHRKKVLFSGCAFHIYHDSIADGLAVLLPFWKIAFDLSLAQVGFLITCFESATALFQIPAGFLGERFGERSMLTLGTIVTAGCFVLIAFAGHPFTLCTLLIIGGLGAGVQHPLAASMISKAYIGGRQRVVLGTYNFTGDMGKLLFPTLAAGVLIYTGWRTLCFWYGVFGLLVAGGLYLMLRRNRTGANGSAGDTQTKKLTGWGIQKKRAFTVLCVIGFVDTGVRSSLIAYTPFLLIEKGMAMASTGLALSLLFVGGALGKFFCGIMAEKIGVTPSIAITEAATGIGIFLLYFLPLNAILPLLPLLGIALNGTSSVLYGTVADFVRPSHTPRAFGLFYTVIISAAAITPPIFGMLADARGIGINIIVLGLTAIFTLPLTLMLHKEMST
jgi:MFS family permease